MSEEIIKVLDALGEKFGIAIDWTGENVLPYVEELFQKATNWLIGEAVVLGGVCLLLSIGLVVLGVLLIRNSEGDDDFVGMGLICISVGLILVIPVICNILQIVKCCTCPELALLPLIEGLF